jgi:hypothetical protein
MTPSPLNQPCVEMTASAISAPEAAVSRDLSEARIATGLGTKAAVAPRRLRRAEPAAQGRHGVGSELADGRRGGGAHSHCSRAGDGCSSTFLLVCSGPPDQRPVAAPMAAGRLQESRGRAPDGAERARNKRSNRPPAPAISDPSSHETPEDTPMTGGDWTECPPRPFKGGSVKPSSDCSSATRTGEPRRRQLRCARGAARGPKRGGRR